ncbi:hypothetical protein ILUMI_07573 [Ignelater luminosus]|uniref:Phosphoglycolate phosphatase n=1 Tax=Ignelater luminosus TaxID=2038154 RepID=A0A8K0D938_IGNLU|nr:hypothetical protein ILUMI_07573 [Ignelater luminosus]
MKDLASLSSAEFKQFLDSFDNILCDCDGVIFPLHKPIINVKESILKLRQCGKRVRFVTNNCFDGFMLLSQIFDKTDCKINLDDVVYPTLAMIDYFKSINFDKEIYVLGFPIMKKEFEKAGFKLADLPDKMEDSRAGIRTFAKINPNIGAVIVDADLNLNFPKIFKAATHLKRPDVIFMTGATDRRIPVGANFEFMGPGYFQQALIDFTGRVPLGFGKPGLPFSNYVNKKFNITNPSKTLFVGDSLEQDIGFSAQSGYQTLLVLTGATTMDHVSENNNKEWVPNFYVNSFGDLHQLIIDKLGI